MNYYKTGTGKKTLVFLHGWGGSWQSWAPIMNKLKSDFTVYAVDLPGFGLTFLPKPYHLDDYTLELADFLKSKKLDKPVLVGHSFGGQIVAKFALKYPEKLSKLVLVDAAVIRNNSKQMERYIKFAKFGKKIVKNSPLAPFYKQIRVFYYRMRRIEVEDSDYLKADNNPLLQQTLSNIMREDLTAELEQIKTPTLLFWGEKDHPDYTPIDYAYQIKQLIKDSELVIVPGGSHFSYLDDQELFCKALAEFV